MQIAGQCCKGHHPVITCQLPSEDPSGPLDKGEDDWLFRYKRELGDKNKWLNMCRGKKTVLYPNHSISLDPRTSQLVPVSCIPNVGVAAREICPVGKNILSLMLFSIFAVW